MGFEFQLDLRLRISGEGIIRRLFAIFISILLGVGSVALPASSSVNPNVLQYQGHGPSDGEFSAWTKLLANGTQVKLYAKYPQVGQKIQFVVQDENGLYQERAWLRVESADLTQSGSYENLQNFVYLIRTFDLKPGKNRFRVLVDGENVTGTKTYVSRPASPPVQEAPGYPDEDTPQPGVPENEHDSPHGSDPDNSNRAPDEIYMISPPRVTGTLEMGGLLQGIEGRWQGSNGDPVSTEYSWIACFSENPEKNELGRITEFACWYNVSGSSSSTYVIDRDGLYIFFQVKASIPSGEALYASALAGIVPDDFPEDAPQPLPEDAPQPLPEDAPQPLPELDSPEEPSLYGLDLSSTVAGYVATAFWVQPADLVTYHFYECLTTHGPYGGDATISLGYVPDDCVLVQSSSFSGYSSLNPNVSVSVAVELNRSRHNLVLVRGSTGDFVTERISQTENSLAKPQAWVLNDISLSGTRVSVSALMDGKQLGLDYDYVWYKCSSAHYPGSELPSDCTRTSIQTGAEFHFTSGYEIGMFIMASVSTRFSSVLTGTVGPLVETMDEDL
jgi:hypothetical protein